MNDPPVITAFLDASVLYPALLRNILMRLALHGLFRARWSSRVQDEWCEALLRNRPDLNRAQIERTRHLMDSHIQDAEVIGFDDLIESLALPDPGDRHVFAAVIHCNARLIVTANLRHFPPAALAGFGIEAVHPDTFILGLIEEDQDRVVAAIRGLHVSLRNPPRLAADLLADMKHQALTASADALEGLIE